MPSCSRSWTTGTVSVQQDADIKEGARTNLHSKGLFIVSAPVEEVVTQHSYVSPLRSCQRLLDIRTSFFEASAKCCVFSGRMDSVREKLKMGQVI